MEDKDSQGQNGDDRGTVYDPPFDWTKMGDFFLFFFELCSYLRG